MPNAYGHSSQTAHITIGNVGPLVCTTIKLVKTFNNADTTVTDNGWGKLCPIYREWKVEVEMPSRRADGSDTITDAFDIPAFPGNVEDVAIPEVNFRLPNGRTYVGYGMLDGDVTVDASAKDAVRLKFTVKGSDVLKVA